MDNTIDVSQRAPSEVMKLDRLGSFHPTRMSFTRTLVRRMHWENWQIRLAASSLDTDGFGFIVYHIETASGPLSFIAFSNSIDDSERTDRVIAEKWDLTFTLFNGIADAQDVARLEKQVPLQEAGRMSENEIVLSRANKSMRLFNSVVDSLANGQQPDVKSIAAVGYLVRTTAVYGNGKFGCCDFLNVKKNSPFSLPFQAEMLAVYMARQLSFDLVEYIAQKRGGHKAVQLDSSLKRALGVGNATGLGMAPFLVGHPLLIHTWMNVREYAIGKIKSKPTTSKSVIDKLNELLMRFSQHLDQWTTDDECQHKRLAVLKTEVEMLKALAPSVLNVDYPWKYLTNWAQSETSLECQEFVNSLILELHPDLVNVMERFMGDDENYEIDSTMSVQRLKNMIEQDYDWALELDFSSSESQHLFWYFSQEKEEPRIGVRHLESGCEKEMRVGVARDVSLLHDQLNCLPDESMSMTIADFLINHPSQRHIITRIQSLHNFPYAEIRDNLLDISCRPIDLLRCKLSIFGATRFDPKSNLWTRITLFQGAPLPHELQNENADDWAYPVVQVPDSCPAHTARAN